MALAKKTKKNVNGIIYLFENHVNGNLMEWSTVLNNVHMMTFSSNSKGDILMLIFFFFQKLQRIDIIAR